MTAHGLPALLLGLGLGLAAGAAAAPAPGGEELADLESQADYAFYTGDARLAARVLAGAATRAAGDDGRARYQYAHAAFRRLQLAVHDRERPAAESAGQACEKALSGLPERDPLAAEAYALRAACAGYLALDGGLRGRLLAARIDGWLEAGAALDARNPRLRLARGLALWYRSEPPPDRVARARADFDAAAALLDLPRATSPGDPAWGAADAWLFAGHAAAATGDVAAARSAYERALLAAPEFAAARRALDGLLQRH
jgi:hypothetical protein